MWKPEDGQYRPKHVVSFLEYIFSKTSCVFDYIPSHLVCRYTSEKFIEKQTFEMTTPKSNLQSNNSDLLDCIKWELFRQSLRKDTGEHFN